MSNATCHSTDRISAPRARGGPGRQAPTAKLCQALLKLQRLAPAALPVVPTPTADQRAVHRRPARCAWRLTSDGEREMPLRHTVQG